MRLYMIRHGETDWNKARKVQGKSDIELNDFGRSLAVKTGQGLRDIRFDAAITSPLRRAKETAELILQGRDVELMEDERLEEISFGIYEGLCCKGENADLSASALADFFYNTERYRAPEGGESFRDLLDRTGAFLEELYQKKEYEDAVLLISTHGATLRAMLNHIRGIGTKDFWGAGVHKNCAVTIVDVKDGKASVVEEGIVYYDDETEDW